MKHRLRSLFLSWVNDFLTVDAFAAYYGMTRATALRVISIGRTLHERNAARA